MELFSEWVRWLFDCICVQDSISRTCTEVKARLSCFWNPALQLILKAITLAQRLDQFSAWQRFVLVDLWHLRGFYRECINGILWYFINHILLWLMIQAKCLPISLYINVTTVFFLEAFPLTCPTFFPSSWFYSTFPSPAPVKHFTKACKGVLVWNSPTGNLTWT